MLCENIAERQNEVHNTYINYGIHAEVGVGVVGMCNKDMTVNLQPA